TLPLPPQGAQPIFPLAAQAPQPSLPRPSHLLHWSLTSSTFPTPTSAISPLPLHLAQAKAPEPLHEAQLSAPAPAQALQFTATTTLPLAPQVPQARTPEPEQVRQAGGGGGASLWMTWTSQPTERRSIASTASRIEVDFTGRLLYLGNRVGRH